jgi:hypothetical protein
LVTLETLHWEGDSGQTVLRTPLDLKSEGGGGTHQQLIELLVKPARQQLLESLAEADDQFMNLYLEEKITSPDIRAALRRAVSPRFFLLHTLHLTYSSFFLGDQQQGRRRLCWFFLQEARRSAPDGRHRAVFAVTEGQTASQRHRPQRRETPTQSRSSGLFFGFFVLV